MRLFGCTIKNEHERSWTPCRCPWYRTRLRVPHQLQHTKYWEIHEITKGSSSRWFTLIPFGINYSHRANYSSRLLTLCDLLEPQHILRRDDGVSAQFFFSSNRDAHVWRVAALLHFHVQRGGSCSANKPNRGLKLSGALVASPFGTD